MRGAYSPRSIETKVRMRFIIISLIVTMFAGILIFAWKAGHANAAVSSITVKEINYENSTITLQGNSADTRIYFSDSKGTTWEAIPGELGSDKTITMDISWILVSSKYTIKFKGDVSTQVVTVAIPKQQTTFKATYNRVKQLVTYMNQGNRSVQWRKKDSYIWNTVNSSTFPSELEMLSTQGSTVYLRLVPVNGATVNGILTVGERPSKEVSITIPKKVDAPKVTINGSKFSIPVIKNMAYRIVAEDGTLSEWVMVKATTNLMLSDIAASALYVNSSTTQSKVTLQFRKNATSSTQVSHLATVTVPIQEGAPDETESGISISYTSSTSLSLTVKAASITKPFEYTIVEPGKTLDYQEASWTAITSSTAIKITSTKAPEGSLIYVRKKSIEGNGSDIEFTLASKEINVTGNTGTVYPSVATATNLTTLITTAGVCNPENTSGNLSFTLYSPTKTSVSSISFRDQYGNTKGTVSFKSTVAANNSATRSTDQYIITTKITSTENINRFTEEKLYADITMENGDKVGSTVSTGVLLYIYPETSVNNEGEDDFTDKFERILSSTESSDDTSFTFNLDFGKQYVVDTTGIDKFNSDLVKISSMMYDNYTLVEGTDYNVNYGSYTDKDGETIRTATVTVNVGSFESSTGVTKHGTALPLIITLNNGETLENDVTIKLVETAKMLKTPIAWSIMEGSLKETTTETITNEDKTTTTVEKEVITFELNLEIFSSSYEVGISDVTWGGQSVLKSAEISGGKATIYLSNPKINKLTTTSTTTNNLVITLSNGYVIKSGCKLTIIDAY